MTSKQVRRLHRDMDHPDHTQMTTECIRLGRKVDRIGYLRLYRNARCVKAQVGHGHGMDWQNSTHNFQTTSGIGMPFLYFEKASQDEARIKVNGGNASISGELLLVEDASAGADFVFYAPTGSTWTKSGTVYTSSLNGKNYWSMAMLPQNTSNASAVAQEYKQYAYVFPTDTTVDWSYNPAT